MAEAPTLTQRLDALYEFDREEVTPGSLQGATNFIGMYAGEHVAGTEFVIGPLFVAHGVTASALFIGLLFGNLLAVLSWAFLCAPIAVKTRLTLYWHLRKICGPYLTFIYSIVNALMFCFLAGSMIAVAGHSSRAAIPHAHAGTERFLPHECNLDRGGVRRRRGGDLSCHSRL